MRIISRRPIREFAANHPAAKSSLDAWFAEVSKVHWRSFAEVRARYGSADVLPENRVVFNLGGNKHWLVVKVDYAHEIAFVRFIGTHAEYDKIDARKI